MPTVTLKFKDNVLGTYALQPGKSLTIGRRQGNDILVENLAVSGHHAKIDSVGDGYLITDLQSKNGSFVNQERVASHWLKHGDVITIGKHTLEFTYDDGEARPPSDDGAMARTMVVNAAQFRQMNPESTLGILPCAETEKAIGVLSFLKGGQGEVELIKKITKIGKNATSDIVVGGLLVGHTAATISRRPNGYSLAYVEGMAKPKVNGETVKESVMLKEFDDIEIGSIKMQFILKS